MFQVASRPAYDHFASGPLSPTFETPSSPASALVQLPRKLARPHFSQVSRDAIVRANPELADVPLEYIRSGLMAQANHMLAASKAIQPHLPASASRSSLPPALALPNAGSSAPTHILAVCSSSKTPSPAPCALHPTHHLVLLASCAHLPALPAARAGARSAPVVPVSVPSADTFGALHAYLYTRGASALVGQLLHLALPPNALCAGPSDARKGAGALAGQLAHALVQATGGDLARMMAAAKRVNGCWKNACALGVYDLELWDAIDLAWDAVLGAMNLVVRQ